MEKEYLFKLNVQPHVLEKYSGEQKIVLKNQLIPQMICFSFGTDLFSLEDCNPEMTDEELSFQIVRDYKEILESQDYMQLLELTHELTLEYVRISRDFNRGRGIHYSQDYLDKHETAMELRRSVLDAYEELKPSQNEYSTSEIDNILENEYQFKIMSKVGTGIDHIRRVKRMALFLERFEEDSVETIPIVYRFESEVLGIRTKSQQEAALLHRVLERNINRSGNLDKVGKVTINPIYESIILDIDERNAKTIEIITTYPNNPDDELEDLTTDINEIFGTKENRMTLVLPDTKRNEKIWRKILAFINKYARLGYLRGVNRNGSSVLDMDNSVLATRGNQNA